MAPELLTVIVSSVSCVAVCLVILLLVVVLYRKDPLCCRYRPPRTDHCMDYAPHYQSRHSLIGITFNESSAAMNLGAVGPQLPGRLFIVGKPQDYHLSEPLPRLPSYESVCKKDQQRRIRATISQHFGLSGCRDENENKQDTAFPLASCTDYKLQPPPPYEEALCHSSDISPVHLHSFDVHLSLHTQDPSSDHSEDTQDPNQAAMGHQGLPSSFL